MVLSVALNYGGRAEIVDATRAAVRRLMDEGIRPDESPKNESPTSFTRETCLI